MNRIIKSNIKKFGYGLIKRTFKFYNSVVAIFQKNHLNSMMLNLCRAAESESSYVMYQIKPKNTSVIPTLRNACCSHNFAIVLQGPICNKDNMTIESICFYKKIYPDTQIIVSTWKDENQEDINRMQELGVIVVLCDKPLQSGIMNVNYQLISSLEGLKKAKELGYKFAVKTRTDQRICKPYIFHSMLSAVMLFPCENKQKGRLVTLGYWAGGMFIPYHTCDFLYLGYTEDLLNVFSAPLDCRNNDMTIREKNLLLTRRQLSESMRAPEIYILKHYCMDYLGTSGEDTIEEYWNITKKFLICYGMKDVDMMWNKYDKIYDLQFYSSSYFGDTDSADQMLTMCFDFFNWFNLYFGVMKYNKSYEQYADVKLNAKK